MWCYVVKMVDRLFTMHIFFSGAKALIYGVDSQQPERRLNSLTVDVEKKLRPNWFLFNEKNIKKGSPKEMKRVNWNGNLFIGWDFGMKNFCYLCIWLVRHFPPPFEKLELHQSLFFFASTTRLNWPKKCHSDHHRQNRISYLSHLLPMTIFSLRYNLNLVSMYTDI